MGKPHWADSYRGKLASPKKATEAIKHGKRVFVGSSCGEPQCLVKELANQAYRFCDLEIVRLMSLESSPLTQIASATLRALSAACSVPIPRPPASQPTTQRPSIGIRGLGLRFPTWSNR